VENREELFGVFLCLGRILVSSFAMNISNNENPTSPKGEDDSENIVRDTLQQIDLVYRLAELYSDQWEICESADDVMRIFHKGKFVSLMGVEGLHQIGDSTSVLRMYHKLGVRYVTLTHSKHNQYADSAVSLLLFFLFEDLS
jgi:membrane dipeptidase